MQKHTYNWEHMPEDLDGKLQRGETGPVPDHTVTVQMKTVSEHIAHLMERLSRSFLLPPADTGGEPGTTEVVET